MNLKTAIHEINRRCNAIKWCLEHNSAFTLEVETYEINPRTLTGLILLSDGSRITIDLLGDRGSVRNDPEDYHPDLVSALPELKFD